MAMIAKIAKVATPLVSYKKEVAHSIYLHMKWGTKWEPGQHPAIILPLFPRAAAAKIFPESLIDETATTTSTTRWHAETQAEAAFLIGSLLADHKKDCAGLT